MNARRSAKVSGLEIKRLHEVLISSHGDLARELQRLIADYVADKNEVRSDYAGAEILGNWQRAQEFERVCNDYGGRVFGICLNKYLLAMRWEDHPHGEEEDHYVIYYRTHRSPAIRKSV